MADPQKITSRGESNWRSSRKKKETPEQVEDFWWVIDTCTCTHRDQARSTGT